MTHEAKSLSPQAYARRLRSVVVRHAAQWVSRSITIRDQNARAARDRYDFTLMRAELHASIEKEFRHELAPRADQACWALAGVLSCMAIELPEGPVSLLEVLTP